jgi:hypothetical protein
MKFMFVVIAIENVAKIQEFASEDGTRYRVPPKDIESVLMPHRLIMDGTILTLEGGTLGEVGAWLDIEGRKEFWTASRETAEAAAATVVEFAQTAPTSIFRDFGHCM